MMFHSTYDYDADRDGPLVFCDFCFLSGGRICPDCDGAHFDTYRINSERCTSCLDALSHNALDLAYDIVYDERVAVDGTVDITGLSIPQAEIQGALEIVKEWFEAGEIEFDPV